MFWIAVGSRGIDICKRFAKVIMRDVVDPCAPESSLVEMSTLVPSMDMIKSRGKLGHEPEDDSERLTR